MVISSDQSVNHRRVEVDEGNLVQFSHLRDEIREICKTIQNSKEFGLDVRDALIARVINLQKLAIAVEEKVDSEISAANSATSLIDLLIHEHLIQSKAHEAAQHFLELAELCVKEETRKELVDFLIPLYLSRKEKQRNLRHTYDLDTNLSTRTNNDGQVDRSNTLFEGMLEKNSGDDYQVQPRKKKRKFQSEECNHEKDQQSKIELWRDVQPNVEKVVIFKKKLTSCTVDFENGVRFIVPSEKALYFPAILDPSKRETVVIEDFRAKRFTVKCKQERGQYMLRAGWGNIVKAHNLKVDDTVVFSVNREYALFIHTEKQHNLPHASDECGNNFQSPDASDNTLIDLLIHELLVETGSDEKAESFREMAELFKDKEKREKPFQKVVFEYLSKAHLKSPVKGASEKPGSEGSDHKYSCLAAPAE